MENLDRGTGLKITELKTPKIKTKFEAEQILPVDKFKTYPMDTEADLIALLRQTKNIKKTERIHKNRSFMLAEDLGFTDDGKLKIGGFLSNGISGKSKILQRFFEDISFSRMNFNVTYRHEK